MKIKNLLFLWMVFSVSLLKAQNCNFPPIGTTSTRDVVLVSGDSTYQAQWIIDSTVVLNGSFVSYTFQADGAHQVCLQLLDSANTIACSSCQTVIVATDTNSANCSFVATVSGKTVVVSPQIASGTLAMFNYGDGSGYLYTSTHTYNSGGSYLISMKVMSNNNTVVCNYSDSVLVMTDTSVTNSCGFNTQIQGNGLVYVWYDSTTVPAGFTPWWNFGDGTQVTHIGQHTYTTTGVYTVTLQVADTNGTIVCTSTNSIYVDLGNTNSCQFSVNVDGNGLVYSTIDSNYLAGNYQFLINYGDGTSPTNELSHHYTSSGVYPVTVSYYSNGAVVCTATQTVSVTVGSSSGCSFVAAISSQNVVTLSSLNPIDSNYTVSVNYGDGTAQTASLAHAYQTAGNYLIVVSLINGPSGAIVCSDTLFITLNGGGNNGVNCDADFAYAADLNTVYFIDASIGNPANSTYYWSFGDGTTSNQRHVEHTYTTLGTYNVCLVVSGPSCSDSVCKSVTLVNDTLNYPVCNANFALVQDSAYNIALVDLSSGVNLSYYWSFGDDTYSNSMYPVHNYPYTGAFEICLTVSGANCSSTHCDSLFIDSLGFSRAGFVLNVVSPVQITTGIVKLNAAQLTLAAMPNPFDNQIQISGLENTAEYTLSTLEGRVVEQGQLDAQSAVISADSLTKGLYFLTIKSSDRIFVTKMLKN